MRKQAKYNMRSKSSEGDNQKASEQEYDENDDENNESYIQVQHKVDKNGPHPLRMKR